VRAPLSWLKIRFDVVAPTAVAYSVKKAAFSIEADAG